MVIEQCFLFSRIIGQLTPKNIYFHYLKKCFLDQSIQKNILFNFDKGSTVIEYLDPKSHCYHVTLHAHDGGNTQ